MAMYLIVSTVNTSGKLKSHSSPKNLFQVGKNSELHNSIPLLKENSFGFNSLIEV